MTAPTLEVQFVLGDRDGNTATMTAYVSLSLTNEQALAFINEYWNLINPLTKGVLLQVKTYHRHVFEDAPEPSMDSDVNASIVLYYSNGVTYEAIQVPSPALNLFEVEGPFAGIRADATASAIVAWNSEVADPSIVLTTPEGEVFPSVYAVGGIAK